MLSCNANLHFLRCISLLLCSKVRCTQSKRFSLSRVSFCCNSSWSTLVLISLLNLSGSAKKGNSYYVVYVYTSFFLK
ncbi:hypothetical protein JG688_00018600 [Phytophthora aleatoria]|uniref:Secreted protein n=1 Tax=Phytophthora aleatoria TaxID=2496075 RepID=A0A8J5I8F9_9STRA|nr:hypothetical protein JG688_00018600 [Phytophthora aleatoria]